MGFDIYQAVTDRIIQELEKGIIPWHKPWIASGGCVSHESGKPYSLLNQILLGREGEWITYKQAEAEGGHVKKGEKGKMVVFWKSFEKKDDDGNIIMGDDGKPELNFMLRYYTVFHIDQCEGIEPKWSKELAEHAEPQEKAEFIIDAYIKREGIKLEKVLTNEAYYIPALDMVHIPCIEQYKSVAEYYSTAFHELTHSTGHSKRLNRIAKVAMFGSSDYSKEELVAEIGASTLVSIVGLETPESLKNNAAYIQNWLKALHNDKRMIVSAAGKAEKAVQYILG